jgi:RNA polymerase sigma-70 factor (ECF subfamily)
MGKDTKVIFEKIYNENADAIFRFVLFRVSDRQQAIDIEQEAFVRFWQKLQTEDIGEPRAFLFKITRNLVIDWYRKSKSIPMQNFSEERSDGNPEVSMDMFTSSIISGEVISEARIAVDQIQSLEPIYREVVYLRFVEELTPKEIAKILGESPNVISVRINRGVTELRSKFNI